MTLSQVFYEAACRMSNNRTGMSCTEAWRAGEDANYPADCYFLYQNVMANEEPSTEDDMPYLSMSATELAAEMIGWPAHHFRTFMLLMASEAVK